MSHLEKDVSVAKDALGLGTPFYLGGILVNPGRNLIEHPDGGQEIQPKLMSVLCYLCERAGQVVSADDLIAACWPDQYVSDSPIHKAINQLRAILQDTARDSKYIKTVARKGYTVVARVEGLGRQLSTTAAFWTRGSPFPGARPFRQHEQSIFHARGQITNNIVEWLLARTGATTGTSPSGTSRHQSNSMTLYGPIGGGKTSLVQAGVVPAFVAKLSPQHAQSNPWRHCDLAADAGRPAYRTMLEFLTDQEMADDQVDTDLERLLDAPENKVEITRDVASFLQQRIESQTLRYKAVISIDHLETVITDNARDRAVFALIIETLAASDRYILFTVAQDHALPQLAKMIKGWDASYKMGLPALSHGEIADIIQKPANAAGLAFERHEESRERLDTLLIHQQRVNPVALAVLQAALTGLYANKEGNTLTYAGYEKLGGIEGCLAEAAEEAFKQLPEAAQTSLYRHLFGFIELNAAGDTMALAAPLPLTAFDEETRQNLLLPLLLAGVFTSSIASGAVHIRLAHDSLLNRWPRLRKWVNACAARFYLQHDIAIATERWTQHDRHRAFLLMDRRTVKAAESLISEGNFRISREAEAFVERSARGVSFRTAVRLSVASVLTVMVIALGWLTQSLQQRTEQLETSITSAQNLVSTVLYDFKEKLEPLGKLELLEAVGAKAKDYFDQSGTRNLSPQSLVQWTESLNIMGQVHADKLEYDEAQALFEKSKQALDEALTDNADNIGLLKQAMLTNYWLGFVHYRRHEYDQAQPFNKIYLAYAQALAAKQPSLEEWQMEISYALTNLGAVAEKTSNLHDATIFLAKSATIKRKLVEAAPNNHKLRDGLANTLSWQASTTKKLGALTAALQLHDEALAEGNVLLEINPENLKWVLRVALLGHMRAETLYDMGFLKQSHSQSLTVNRQLKRLVENDPSNDRAKKRLAYNHVLLSRTLRHQGRYDEGLRYINSAFALSQHAALISETNLHAEIFQEQARLFSSLGQNLTALSSIERALAFFDSAKGTQSPILPNLLLTKSRILTELNWPLSEKLLNQLAASQHDIWTLIENSQSTPEHVALFVAISQICCTVTQQHKKMLQEPSEYQNPDTVFKPRANLAQQIDREKTTKR